MTTYEVARAEEKDISAICDILQRTAKWLAESGMHNWDGFYTSQRVSEYFQDREIYCIRLKDEIVGTVTLNAADNEPGWYSNRPALYLNALAVSPSHHGQGIASTLLRYAEDVARREGYEVLRLDAVEEYLRLTDFYERRGYQVVGTVQRRFRYHQFEKSIVPD